MCLIVNLPAPSDGVFGPTAWLGVAWYDFCRDYATNRSGANELALVGKVAS